MEGLPVETVCRRVLDLQTKALLQKMRYTNKTKLIIGVSGGMDSTAALLACRECCKRNGLSVENIIGVTMPGPGTTDRTLRNARRLMDTLGVTSMTVNIHEATESLLADIGQPEGLFNVTYEQTQSRQRTRILMDLANKTDGLVIGTGDMSEFALGWMSYSGDHISMYAINCGIPKTVIRHMVGWFCDAAEGALKEILLDIMKTPISPELLPVNHDGRQTQSTEKLVGPYIVHDFFLYHFLVNGCETAKIYKLACDAFSGVYEAREIRDWLKLFIRRFFTRQFKRSCFSDGAQYFSVGLSPRSAWRMPSDVSCSEWLAEIERIP